MKRYFPGVAAGLAVLVSPLVSLGDEVDRVLRSLNEGANVKGSEEIKSYPVLLRAYLTLDEPPREVGEEFNHTTIHPGMTEWGEVSGWAESNPEMARAILECETKTMFGLPYGAEQVEREFREAGLVADIGAGGSLRDNQFRYLEAIETICAYATAESYRLLEAGRIQEGLDLAVATVFVGRQCCDRDFLVEELHCIATLAELLGNLRDMFYVYQDEITTQQYFDIANKKLPFLRPDRSRLFMPEGDRVVSEALIGEVFGPRGEADRERFASTFAAIQSRDAPLTRFGAARRWRLIAEVHASDEASHERLQLVYDDWWRRWRVEEYDEILAISTQFERTNPIRYAAVIYSMQNIEELFEVRNELMAAVYGTAMAAGLCGYHNQFGTYPRDSDMTYAMFVRKSLDRDPFDLQFLPFKYYLTDERTAIDTLSGRLWLEAGTGVLYSRGQDNMDDRAKEHTDDGARGDIVIWPPIKALLREQDLIY